MDRMGTMQRLYAMFPDRGPGAGLLLLRLGLAVMLLADAHGRLPGPDAPASQLILWLPAMLLASGGLMPPALLLSAIAIVVRMPPALALPHLLLPTALLLLGPGAYSLDARLFGRRSVVDALHWFGSLNDKLNDQQQQIAKAILKEIEDAVRRNHLQLWQKMRMW